MSRINESAKKDLVFTFVTIPGEYILERARISFRNKTLLKIKKLEKLIESSSGYEYGRFMLDIDEFLYDENLKIPVYIQSTGKMTSSDKNKLSMFMKNIDEYEMYVRETMLAYYLKNNIDFSKMNTKACADILSSIQYDLNSIDNICDLAYIIIENDYMGIGISTYWNGSFYEIPIIIKDKRVSLNCETRKVKINGDIKIVSINEITTFRDLEERPDLGMVITHGSVRAFFGKKSVHFPVWLLRTYDIFELQENRFKEFQKSYSYYSNLIVDAIIKYFGINYPSIVKDSPQMKEYTRNINKKQMAKLLNLARLEISSNGSTYAIVKTEWGEELTVQIWNKDVKLTNYFSLPIVGSRYGRI